MMAYKISGVPLTRVPSQELAEHMWAWSDPNYTHPNYMPGTDPALPDAVEQARIILFAREMGWL